MADQEAALDAGLARLSRIAPSGSEVVIASGFEALGETFADRLGQLAQVSTPRDPGTGSMLLQVILGGIAAIGVALKLGWHKIRAALGFRRKPAAEEEQNQEVS
mgnify:CR=1 FL=1